ncbi:MAG: hypothetical protein WCK09_15405 [Bacteroidota bacterium]
MITNNRLDRSFGTVGSSAGVFVFIAGSILTCLYFSALILVLIGAFVGFTTSSSLIDYGKKQVKFSNNLFGLIRIGKWMPLEPSMKIGIKESNQVYRTFSRSNRALDVTQNDFRLILYDSGNNEIMPIKKLESLDAAKIELEIECKRLGLAIFGQTI